MDGYALRVPVPTGSITDLTVERGVDVTVEEINAAIKEAAEGEYAGIIEYVNRIPSSPVTSSTIPISPSIRTTKVIGGNMAKVTMWYDNEWGYSNRTAG